MTKIQKELREERRRRARAERALHDRKQDMATPIFLLIVTGILALIWLGTWLHGNYKENQSRQRFEQSLQDAR